MPVLADRRSREPQQSSNLSLSLALRLHSQYCRFVFRIRRLALRSRNQFTVLYLLMKKRQTTRGFEPIQFALGDINGIIRCLAALKRNAQRQESDEIEIERFGCSLRSCSCS